MTTQLFREDSFPEKNQASKAATNTANNISVFVCLAFVFSNGGVAILKQETTSSQMKAPELGELVLPSCELNKGRSIKDAVERIAKAARVNIDLEVPLRQIGFASDRSEAVTKVFLVYECAEWRGELSSSDFVRIAHISLLNDVVLKDREDESLWRLLLRYRNAEKATYASLPGAGAGPGVGPVPGPVPGPGPGPGPGVGPGVGAGRPPYPYPLRPLPRPHKARWRRF